ncbi:hypothetical protein [Streptomyces cyslabdanicus]|uniref:hypothetical protein n=1 Tax=Streptomyces cyslabdanicus TaxID=1470456 RepID=UPI0040445E74
MGDLDKLIAHGTRLMNILSADDPQRRNVVQVVAAGLRVRAAAGDVADLDRAIELVDEVLGASAAESPERRQHLLNQQSANYLDRFQQSLRPADLDHALLYAEKACSVAHCAADSAPRVQFAVCLSQRHQHRGRPQDLDRALEIYRSAWKSIHDRVAESAGHREAAEPEAYTDADTGILYNLSTALAQRYTLHHIPSDIQESAEAIVTALRLTPEHHRGRLDRLTAAAHIFRQRWTWSESTEDLETATSYAEEALRLAGPGSFRHEHAVAAYMSVSRGRRTDEEVLNQAIDISVQAPERTDVPQAHRHLVAVNTAAALARRWKDTGARNDLEKAIEISRRLVAEVGTDAAVKSALLLGEALADHAHHYGDSRSREEACAVLRGVASLDTAPIKDRFRAAREWVTVSERASEEALAAVRQLMELMPLVAWVGAPREVRESALAERAGIASHAAEAALEAGRPIDALEFLELGRGVLWSQQLDLRTDLARIEAVDPRLAGRLAEVRGVLDSTPPDTEDGGLAAVWTPDRLTQPDPQPIDPDWHAALQQAAELCDRDDYESLVEVLGPLTDADDPRVVARAEFVRGVALRKRGEREAARVALARASQAESSDVAPAAAILLGRLLAEDGDFAAARTAFEQAKASGIPEVVEEAELRLRTVKSLDADAACLPPEMARLLAEGDPSTMLEVSAACVLKGQFAEAQVLLERCLLAVASEERPNVAYLLAPLRQRHADYPGARVAWELALKTKHPKLAAVAALQLGDLLVAEFTVAEARDAYRNAPRQKKRAVRKRLAAIEPLAPSSASDRIPDFDYGRWLAHHQPREYALDVLSRAVKAGDQRARTHFYLSEVLARGEHGRTKVQLALHRAIALATEDETALVLLCRAILRMRRGDAGGSCLLFDEAYQAAVARGDAELAALAAVVPAHLYQRSGDTDAARTAYERAVTTGHPQFSPLASFCLAVMLDGLGDEEEAKRIYRQVMASGHPVQGGMAAYNLGCCLARSGDHAAAEEAFQHAANGAWQTAADRAAEALEQLRSMPGTDESGQSEAGNRP